ncbi:hypothetical protein N5D52_07900 [Pseudomonas sp. GD03860]|uniref:hypothetical protein n=1 Tax=Pseudomonas TaxID=286 RepID=UPI00236364C7|nr:MULTISPECIES: hypothetical protein [Pseudomonas]MDD2058625.1 hypothetical protein [Pseudomonas putida]MDH0636858.1 hypothetical protein [Pseudomonas sp. GD03860]
MGCLSHSPARQAAEHAQAEGPANELAQLFCDLRHSGKLRADLGTDAAAFLFSDYGGMVE